MRKSFLMLAALLTVATPLALGQSPVVKQPVLRIGAVASSPEAIKVWRGIRAYFAPTDCPVDYVLYSNYDALVAALKEGQVDVAWNTPLAHAKYHVLAGGKSQTLVMRDVDRDFQAVMIARQDAKASKPADLAGRTLVLGSKDAAEATVLPLFYLRKQGVEVGAMKLLSLHEELDNEGNPCGSERDVLRALQAGRGQAGIISKAMWDRLSRNQPEEAAAFQVIWTSPKFSHCVFTAPVGFDAKVGKRFTELMLAMDGAKLQRCAEILAGEGCKKWIAGTSEGFEDLIKAIQEK